MRDLQRCSPIGLVWIDLWAGKRTRTSNVTTIHLTSAANTSPTTHHHNSQRNQRTTGRTGTHGHTHPTINLHPTIKNTPVQTAPEAFCNQPLYDQPAKYSHMCHPYHPTYTPPTIRDSKQQTPATWPEALAACMRTSTGLPTTPPTKQRTQHPTNTNGQESQHRRNHISTTYRPTTYHPTVKPT